MNVARGFTLIELLLTISILAVLSTVGLVAYNSVSSNGRDQTRLRDLNSIKQALELYRNDSHFYPSTLPFGSPLSSTTGRGSSTSSLVVTYLDLIPQDRTSGQVYL